LWSGKAYHRARQTVSRAGQYPHHFQAHMGPFETIYINETVAACNGGGGALGHPRVFLNLGRDGKVECPYCSRLFVNRAMQEANPSEATAPPKVSEEGNI
jgi:uncharacterized Zn-finger protein